MRVDLQDLVGRTLAGRYRVVRPIGQGGMGAVFEAVQLDLERPVALKVLFDDDPRSVERFRQEAMATAKLRSPNVVAITELVEVPDAPPFLVMELLDGEPLGRLLAREKRLAPERAAGIAVQILAGLAEAHARGIVHRDIKPSNIFLVRSQAGGDVVKILDFGIAKLLDGGMRTTTGALLGTPAYLAPEQVLALPVGPPADVHAVGVLLYEMLSGERPWATQDLMLSIATQPARPLEGAPPWLAAVVARALTKDPGARFPDATAMLAALKDAPTPRVAIAAPTAPSAGPRRLAPFVIAFVVTATVAAAGLVLAARARRVETPVETPDVVASVAAPQPLDPPSTSDAETPHEVEDAAPPPPPIDASRPSRPVLDSQCVCAVRLAGGTRVPVCYGNQSPECYCMALEDQARLCKVPVAEPGKCPVDPGSYVGRAHGLPCEGYRWRDEKSVVAPGTFFCTNCNNTRGVDAVHATPCKGTWPSGQSANGEWVCRVRRR